MLKPKPTHLLKLINDGYRLPHWFDRAARGADRFSIRPVHTLRWGPGWAVEAGCSVSSYRRLIALVGEEPAAERLLAEIATAIRTAERREADALDAAGDPDRLGEIAERAWYDWEERHGGGG